ncbi:O-antigen ligase family protein [Candidatus Endoriftia persephonae]|jgi:O-antigen ligase|uniref:Glycosyl transferase, family 2 n=1 Tax=endosymbiont of Tevnia jerichonana (vent Tica) TaxID=1049564 RepID=G2FJ34_9GAMM|nr:O-antigen ligase family protein [Candidatus Endoriftia persephone]EGW53178.1 glycosyl transferase, family 2 [endosymbiont of Tevnia jerichonana (vent Tica)]
MSARPQWQQQSDELARGMAVAAAFAIPLPTAWVGITMGLFLLFWIASGDFANKWQRVRQNPVALMALGLFALLGLGVSYSSVGLSEALEGWGAYHKLIYIALLVSVLNEPKWQQRALMAFVLAMLLVLLLSYAQLLGFWPEGKPEQEFAPFKGRIAHNFFMAFAAYLVFDLFMRQPARRLLWAGILLLMLYNILVMVPGRTGQLVLFVMVVLATWHHWRWRGLLVGALLTLALGAAAMQFSDGFRPRMQALLDNASSYFEGGAAESSTGLRLSYYENSIELILKHPLIGTGTGSFIHEYQQHANAKGVPLTDNPHNEYLNLGVQLGLLGMGALLLFFLLQWRFAGLMRPEQRRLAQALVLAMALGCLFNSFLMDHGEGKFYVILAGILFARTREATAQALREGTPASLSVIVITRNEAARIRACLESVSWADEILVLDSGSSDETLAICREYTDKVFVNRDWQGFGVQKNRVLDKARGDWVLSIDADEQVPEALQAEIHQLLVLADEAPAVYKIPRLSSYCGRQMRHGGWWPDHVARLFRRGKARFSDDLVHERLLFVPPAGRLENPLTHQSFDNLEQVLEKVNRYSSASAERMLQQGKRGGVGKALLRGLWSFLRGYILRAGFLDGSEGLMLAISNAEGVYYKYLKLYYLGRRR